MYVPISNRNYVSKYHISAALMEIPNQSKASIICSSLGKVTATYHYQVPLYAAKYLTYFYAGVGGVGTFAHLCKLFSFL